DGAAEVFGVVGEHTDGLSVEPGQCGDDACAEPAAQLQHAAGVEQCVDHGPDRVDAQPVLRHQMAQVALVDVLDLGAVAGAEVGQVPARGGDGSGVVADQDVHDAVLPLHVHRPDLLGRDDAEPATFDHGRAAHAEAAALGGDDRVAAACQGG